MEYVVVHYAASVSTVNGTLGRNEQSHDLTYFEVSVGVWEGSRCSTSVHSCRWD